MLSNQICFEMELYNVFTCVKKSRIYFLGKYHYFDIFDTFAQCLVKNMLI